MVSRQFDPLISCIEEELVKTFQDWCSRVLCAEVPDFAHYYALGADGRALEGR